MEQNVTDPMKLAKGKLRKELLTTRRALTAAIVENRSRTIQQHLYTSILYQRAKTIMVYLSMPDEPQTEAIIFHAWNHGKTICVPSLRKSPGLMDAAVIQNMNEIVTGRFGLKVPDPTRLTTIPPEDIDLMLIPGVAFDISGNRLGMGGGYYDRFLPQAPAATLIGVCWRSHILATLPKAKYDQSVHFLLTETGILNCSKGKM